MQINLRRLGLLTCGALAAATLTAGLAAAPASAEPPATSTTETAPDPVIEQTGGEPLTEDEKAKLLSCGSYIDDFWTFGNWIYGDGWFDRCGIYTRAVSHIERSRWDGWESMKSRSRTTTGSLYLSYNCYQTGTHDFRYRISTNYALNGKFGVVTRYSSKVTKKCTG